MSIQETMENFLNTLRGQAGQAEEIPELMDVFVNCYTNTLNTTVKRMENNMTHVITGDIPAMWLRDSAAQLRPYIFLAKENEEIRELIAGLVRRQFMCITIYEYANAFNEAPNGACWERMIRIRIHGFGSGSLRWILCVILFNWHICFGRIQDVLRSLREISRQVWRKFWKCLQRSSIMKKNLITALTEIMAIIGTLYPEMEKAHW